MKTPAVNRKALVLTAGAVWSIVGLALLAAAIHWLAPLREYYQILLLIAGVSGGLLIYRFGFSRLVAINIERIFSQAPGKEKVCFFSFQNSRSYFMVLIMIAMGYTLRHLPISKLYIAPIYAAIGLALVLSSLRYYRCLNS